MALIDDVRTLCQRLAPLGWEAFLKETQGLNIVADDLEAELGRSLPVNRSAPGFADFAAEGVRGVEPGLPARSLIFHALASPLVRDDSLVGYATWEELNTLENYIYASARRSLADLVQEAAGQGLAVAVYASEYRPGATTVHRRHADLTYCRTGLSRVGNTAPHYEGALRSFVVVRKQDEPGSVRVTPSRFSAYVATRRKGNPTTIGPRPFRAGGSVDDDSGLPVDDTAADFWVPLHKLFSGPECLVGRELDVRMEARHVNEKIRRARAALQISPNPDEFPFRFSEGLAELSSDGVLTPVPHPLVEEARHNNRLLTYPVRPGQEVLGAVGPETGRDGSRPAPEYIHARTEVRSDGTKRDLNDDADPNREIRAGGYDALHYVDYSADGWVQARVGGLVSQVVSSLPAYSLVAAPDFFPAVSQQALGEWTREMVPDDLRAGLWRVPPDTLAADRLPANLQLPGGPFSAEDRTITAVVSRPWTGAEQQRPLLELDSPGHSVLADSAAGIFAPGWDTAKDFFGGSLHLAAYGLGSPFPEDAKLCAALSTFWPAVAPDVVRTFEPRFVDRDWPSVAPLTDEEIGVGGEPGWDGVRGPKLVGDGTLVEYSEFDHADYVLMALEGKMSPAHLASVTLDDYRSRVLANARLYRALARADSTSTESAKSRWAILSFRSPTEQERNDLADRGHRLSPTAYRFIAYKHGAQLPAPNNVRAVRVEIISERTLFVDDFGVWGENATNLE